MFSPFWRTTRSATHFNLAPSPSTPRPANLGGTPTLNHFLLGSGPWGFLGGKGFFLTGPAYDAGSNVSSLFEVVFMETAGYIIVGAICERITFWAFLLCELFIGAILYPVSAAGSGAAAGCRRSEPRCIWATATWISPDPRCARGGRILRHGAGHHPRPAPRQIRPGRQDPRLSRAQPRVCGHRHVHSAVRLDGLQSRLDAGRDRSAHFRDRHQYQPGRAWPDRRRRWCSGISMFGKPDITMACNGMLAGLVAITAPCAFVRPTSAVVIGVLAGMLVCCGVLFNERVLKIDDPCGAISVHGFCGWFGGVCVGIFADGTYGAGWNGVGATSLSGPRRTGRNRPAPRRHAPVPLPTRRSDVYVRSGPSARLMSSSSVNKVQFHARSARGGTRRARRPRVRHAGLSRKTRSVPASY